MHLPYEKIFMSPIYTFLVGRHKTKFALHAAAVSHMSAPLAALVNSGMKESREKCATLPDEDSETFARFSQFVYTGDYTPAEPDIQEDDTAAGSPKAPAIGTRNERSRSLFDTLNKYDPSPQRPKATGASDHNATFFTGNWETSRARDQDRGRDSGAGSAHHGLATRWVTPWERFLRIKFDYVAPKLCLPCRSNTTANEDYTPVFICHANLYILADKYDIGPLRRLVLHKLHETLQYFTLFRERVGDVVELAQYAYDHTRDSEHEELRMLVTHYMAGQLDVFCQNTKFHSILREPGSLAKDVVCILSRKPVPEFYWKTP